MNIEGSRRVYIPSPEVIAAECQRFQAGWSDDERDKRMRGTSYRLFDFDADQVRRDAEAKLAERKRKNCSG